MERLNVTCFEWSRKAAVPKYKDVHARVLARQRWLLRTRQKQLDVGGARREEGREAADEVSKDSGEAELYFLQRSLWTASVLHFNKSTQVK